MLIVPERNVIFIFPPRTGSTSLHYAIREACPDSMLLYRHAERDAIPPGYESFKVVGVVRNPLERMFSLFKFICQLDPLTSASWAQADVMRLLESVQGKTFEAWLLGNQELFLPQHTGHPGLYQRLYVPETIKGQWHYLRPDLGTTVIPFPDLAGWMAHWDLPPLHINHTTKKIKTPPMTPLLRKHFEDFMVWELEMGLEEQ